MAVLDLTMVLKLNDKASRKMERFNRTLDKTIKKLQKIGQLQGKNAKGGSASGSVDNISGGVGALGAAGIGAAAGASTAGFTLVTQGLVGLNRIGKKFEKTLTAIFKGLGKNIPANTKLHAGIVKLNKEFKKINIAARKTQRVLGNVGSAATKAGSNAQRSGQKAAKGSKGWSKLKIAILAASVGMIFTLKNMIATGIEFEKMRATLKAVLEPGDNVGDAFKFLTSVAQKLPATMQEVTTSFIRMQQLGLKPTEEKLLSFGETAARSGKSVLQFVEAVADAAVGENERLKEFGIKARVSGETVAFTFKGVTTEVNKTSAAITKYLVGLGKVAEGQSAAENQMATLDGKISNLGVAWDGLSDTITKRFSPIMKEVVDLLGSVVGVINSAFAKSFDFLKKQFIDLFGILDQVSLAYNTLTSLIGKNAAERAKILKSANAESQAIKDNVKALKEKIDAENTVSAGADRFKKVLDDRANALGKYKVEINGTVHSLQTLQEFTQALINNSSDSVRQTENAIAAQSELDELYQDGIITQDVYLESLKRLNEMLGVELPESVSELSEFWTQAFRNMQSDLANFFVEATTKKFSSFRDGMKSLAADFARTINRMVAQWLAAKVLTSGFGMFGIDAGANPRGFADGGRPPINVPSIVGERGPEIFIPDSAGTIIPNEQMGGNTVQVNITAMDSQDVMRSLEENKRGIAEMVFGTQRTYNLGTA